MKTFSKRLVRVCVLGVAVGCSAETTAPPPITSQHRETLKHNLAGLGAKVTAEVPEGLYLSLRNTHVEVRDIGGIIEGTFRTQRDIQDFGTANEAIAKTFLEERDFEKFKQWLRKALSTRHPSVERSEYERFKVTLSRDPLRMVFTRKQVSDVE